MRKNEKTGFTLIEVAVVLVIIALIAGAVVVGRDLINSASARALVSQYEKYRSAMNAFETKYNGMPGDITQAQATQYQLKPTSRPGGSNITHGNEILDEYGSTPNEGCCLASETLLFWQDLSSASLIDGTFTSAVDGPPSAGVSTLPDMQKYLPVGKAGLNTFWSVGNLNGVNYFQVSNMQQINTNGVVFYQPGLTPVQASIIDTKIDDGLPFSGSVQSSAGYDDLFVFQNDGQCASDDAHAPSGHQEYRIDLNADKFVCALGFKF